ncbi:MAG: hypothetical protein A3G20_06155 [Acidobacteria bacterium RIFCSPLOWO2_12_FULL_59_11]|nr:MAG: hypothetical protein A3G20_06155 [Acidobacteria bacterium RIFCSPLOWO2_12_FULL_59_11]
MTTMSSASRYFYWIGLLTAVFLASGASVSARVTRFIIQKKESPAYQGRSFGKTGQYEIIQGRFTGEIDPADPLNAIINDIRLAPRNARGLVEYSATFSLAKPIDMTKASGVLLYTVANRGNGCPVKIPEANCQANVFAYTDGHVGVASGWQGDLRPRPEAQTIVVPAAKNPDGSSINGPVFVPIRNVPQNTQTVALADVIYRPATLDTSKGTLNKRASGGNQIIPVPSSDWAFADCNKISFPGTPDPGKICVKGGFEPAYSYELVFTAKDPLVLGIGYAATRDLNSFLKYEKTDDTGAPNPVATRISWAIAYGSSQSGNFLRSFLHLGFNQDESGRMVWEGANPHIAGRQLAINFRFADASGSSDLYEPGSEAVLWWGDYADEVRNRRKASLLDRCRETGTCPKIFETFGGSEFWQFRMSPDLVGIGARADIPLPPEVRRYFFPGVIHGGGRGGFNTSGPGVEPGCVIAENPNPQRPTMRALTAALVDWVVRGTLPPPSRYPRLDREELVLPTQADMGFPSIPRIPAPDGLINPFYDYDLGSNFNYNDLSGAIAKQPPVIRGVFPMLVPKVNADGNEDVTAVPSVLLQAPLGTYLSWSVLKGASCRQGGGYIPFPKTKKDRLTSGDPRVSLEERYGTHENYVAVVRAAAEKAVRQRFLLGEDADKLIAEAAASDVLAVE